MSGRPLVWDNHGCMPLRAGDGDFLPQLERYRASGIDVVGLNVGFGLQSLEEHVRVLAWFRRWLTDHADRYVLVGTIAEARAAAAAGKLAVFFDIEGTGPLDAGDLGLVQLFYDLGVRWMLMAYNRQTAVGSGCYDETDGGLTAFGRQVLAEMERVGMLVCCSHTGERSALEVIEAARAPVIVSHSNAKAVFDHTRNVSDRVIKAVAASGGVVGVNGVGAFLGDNDASTQTLVAHVDHMVQLVGPDHVGLGLDYVFDMTELVDYLQKMRQTFPHDATYAADIQFVEPERFPGIAAALVAKGYGDADLAKILGGNWTRVAERVWK
ncbi:dipeptidase [Caulobacter soli]|uniref:dipeptidase n=1 Tax=Caulobacter soli TaxID=2708539 RepID=UPI0013E9B9DD|nr:membrane dipeptidase [Caulobacter soli]